MLQLAPVSHQREGVGRLDRLEVDNGWLSTKTEPRVENEGNIGGDPCTSPAELESQNLHIQHRRHGQCRPGTVVHVICHLFDDHFVNLDRNNSYGSPGYGRGRLVHTTADEISISRRHVRMESASRPRSSANVIASFNPRAANGFQG